MIKLGEYHGKLEDVLPNLESGKYQMVFADLPYGTTKCKWDTLVDLDIFWKEVWRGLTQQGLFATD